LIFIFTYPYLAWFPAGILRKKKPEKYRASVNRIKSLRNREAANTDDWGLVKTIIAEKEINLKPGPCNKVIKGYQLELIRLAEANTCSIGSSFQCF
jgi:hypothetical protein